MRLAQLARKLDIPKKDIINYLELRGISIESHGNTKVEEEHEKLVLAHFGYLESTEELAGKSNEPVQQKEDIKKTDPDIEQEKTQPIEDLHKEKSDAKSEEKPVEVIRPKKVKLQGIKVIGKIELPEPPQKEEKEEKRDIQTETSENISPKKYTRKRENKKPFKGRGRKAPRQLSYEEKLKREERERLKKERQRKKELKEKKRRHYEKKVLTKLQTEKKKKKQQGSRPSIERPKKDRIRYKNPLKRFWAWLNGEYDNF